MQLRSILHYVICLCLTSCSRWHLSSPAILTGVLPNSSSQSYVHSTQDAFVYVSKEWFRRGFCFLGPSAESIEQFICYIRYFCTFMWACCITCRAVMRRDSPPPMCAFASLCMGLYIFLYMWEALHRDSFQIALCNTLLQLHRALFSVHVKVPARLSPWHL